MKPKNEILIKRILRIMIERNNKPMSTQEILEALGDDNYRYVPTPNSLSQIIPRFGRKYIGSSYRDFNNGKQRVRHKLWYIHEGVELPADITNPNFYYERSKWYCRNCGYNTPHKKHIQSHTSSPSKCERWEAKQKKGAELVA